MLNLAKKILRESGVDIVAAESMADGAEKIVTLVEQGGNE